MAWIGNSITRTIFVETVCNCLISGQACPMGVEQWGDSVTYRTRITPRFSHGCRPEGFEGAHHAICNPILSVSVIADLQGHLQGRACMDLPIMCCLHAGLQVWRASGVASQDVSALLRWQHGTKPAAAHLQSPRRALGRQSGPESKFTPPNVPLSLKVSACRTSAQISTASIA